MQTQTLAALCPTNRDITKDDILRLIIRRMLPPLFLRRHLKREQVIGTIGEKGGGKSATTSVIALLDQLLDGKPVFSNIHIACDITVTDATAQKFGLNSGGKAHYETQELEKNALLKLDERYRRCAIVIEEINVQYSNVRRFMSNTNVDFNEVVQQLRHLLSSLYYNVIDEMFIDNQLRSMTDAFIKCEDTAYSIDNLANKIPQGQDIKWLIYPMTGNFAGHEKTYYKTKNPLPPMYLHFTKFHGIYDSEYSQRQGIYSQSRKTKNGEVDIMMSTESTKEMEEAFNEWGWLADKAQQLKQAGIKELQPYELWQFLELAERKLRPDNIGGILPSFGIHRDNTKRVYRISNFKVEDMLARAAPEQS